MAFEARRQDYGHRLQHGDRCGLAFGPAGARRSRDRRDRAGCPCGNQQHAYASRGRARYQPHYSLGRLHARHSGLDAGVDVYGCPASSFVEVVEHELASGAHLQEQWLENEDIFDTPAVRALVGATVEPLRDHGIDTVVLGCTHFPLLVGPIRHALGPGVRVVSSAEETTRELTDILTRREQLAGDAAEPQHRFATTADNIAEFAVAGSFIFGQPLKSIEHIDIDELK